MTLPEEVIGTPADRVWLDQMRALRADISGGMGSVDAREAMAMLCGDAPPAEKAPDA